MKHTNRFLAVALVFLSSTAVRANQNVSEGTKFIQGWSPNLATQLQDEPYIIATRHGREQDCYSQFIYRYLEPRSLDADCKFKFGVQKNQSGAYKVLSGHGATLNIFYCAQAIWEATPYSYAEGPATIVCDFSSKSHKGSDDFCCNDTYLHHYPEVGKAVVVTHVVPSCFADLFPEAIGKEELHSISNLRAINLSEVDKPLLVNFRHDWTAFTAKNKDHPPTRRTILEEAGHLVDKYSNLFVATKLQ